jgi:hypothetical protein
MSLNLEYAGRDLQGKSFKGADLKYANFSGADLRSADFTGADLSGADFSKSVTGMKLSYKILIFIGALVISLFSGYLAMMLGTTVQGMIKSTDWHEHYAGLIASGFIVIFTGFSMWKGIYTATRRVLPIMLGIPVVTGLFMVLSGFGTGSGSFYGLYAILLMASMFTVGTISRATAGTLASGILFLIVAVGGGLFGRTVGGGIGTVILAVSCAIISKQALKLENSRSVLKKIALTMGTYYGTSFRKANLTQANFSEAVIQNTDFSKADLSGVNWTHAKKLYTLGEK